VHICTTRPQCRRLTLLKVNQRCAWEISTTRAVGGSQLVTQLPRRSEAWRSLQAGKEFRTQITVSQFLKVFPEAWAVLSFADRLWRRSFTMSRLASEGSDIYGRLIIFLRIGRLLCLLSLKWSHSVFLLDSCSFWSTRRAGITPFPIEFKMQSPVAN